MATETDPVIVRIITSQKDLEKSLASSIRATERAAQRMDKVLGNVGGGRAASNVVQFGKAAADGTRQASQAAGQLSFQLNDIATSLSGGASPFQVMMQQGSQVTQVMQGIKAQGGSMGAVVVGAFRSMLNPIALVSFALIAAAGLAFKYFSSVEEGSSEADKELKKHATALDQIISKYGDLAPEAKVVLERFQDIDKATEAIKELGTQITNLQDYAVEKLTTGLEDAAKKMDEVGGETQLAESLGMDKAAELTAEFSKEFATLVEIIQSGKDPSEQITKVLGILQKLDLAAPNAGFRSMIDILQLKVIPTVDIMLERWKAILGLQQRINGELERMGTYQGAMPGEGGPLDLAPLERARITAASKDAGTSIEFLKTKAASKEIAASLDRLDAETAKAMAKLFAILPESARITSGVRSYAEQARARYRFEHGTGGLAAKPGHSRHEEGTFREGGSALDIGQGVSMEELRAAVKLVPELEQLDAVNERTYQRDKVHVQLKGEALKQEKEIAEQQVQNEEKAAAAAADAQKNLADYLVSLDEQASLQTRINDINANAMLTDEQKKIAIAVETELQNAMNLAKQNGITLSEQEVEVIRRKATANAMATVTADQLADAEKKAAKSAADTAEAQKQFAQQISGVAQSAVGGFINDLRNGVEAGEAFSNMLDRVIDGLINMAVQSLFSQNALGSVFGSLMGGMGGGFPAAPGGGLYKRGGIVGKTRVPLAPINPRDFLGAPSFARGGMPGRPPGSIPAYLHPGELVIPKSMVGKGGSASTTSSSFTDNSRISIDMSKAGVVAADTQGAKQFGENVKKLIQAEMIREARPGGILRQVQSGQI